MLPHAKKTDTFLVIMIGKVSVLMFTCRDFGFCDARFFAGFESPSLRAFYCSFWNPTSFQEPADMIFHLWTPKYPPRKHNREQAYYFLGRMRKDVGMVYS
jgi:hypothetical protein